MDDLEFVQRCIQGDKRSWDEFVEKYSRLIYKYIHSVSKSKGSSLTQGNFNDLFQEIFLSLVADNYKKLRSFKAKNGCSLASWLRQVVINHTIDYLRRTRPLVSIDDGSEDSPGIKDTLASGITSAADILLEEERSLHLKDCIEKLDIHDKYFLELNINMGLDLEELRVILNLSRGTVDMRKSRIIARLKDCFRGKGFLLDS